MATNWVDEVLSGATSTGSKSLNLSTGNALSVANSSSESIFTVTSDTTNGGYTSILGIEGQEAVLFLGADNSDDAGDVWELHSDTSGNFKIGNRTSGTGSPTRSNTFTNALTIDSSRNITVGVDGTGYDVKFFGATSGSFLLWDETDDALELTDSSPLKIGDGGDMTIYHDGSHSYITNATGTLKLATESSGIAVTIGHATSETTIADNATVTGTLTASDNVILSNTKKLYFDGGGDTYIMQNGGDVLDIVVGGDTMMKFTEASTETIAMSAEKVQITGGSSYTPQIIIENTLTSTDSENPAQLVFAKTGEAAADGDKIGRIIFKAIQEGGSAGYDNSEFFAYIQGEVVDSVAASEAGQIAWHIASDSSDVTAMTLAGNASDARCALTLGADGAGCDFKVFGETADNYMEYDQSADKLLIHSDNDGELLRVVSFDDDGDTGPSIGIKRNSDSPANDDDIGALTFLGQDSGDNEVVYGKITSSIVNVTNGSEEGRVLISCHNHNGGSSGQSNVGLRLTGKNDATIDATLAYGAASSTTVSGDLLVTGGDVVAGVNSSTQGTLRLWDGGGGNTPGYIVLYSPDGTANYIFCEDDGTLKRHTSAPTANGDGSEIGGQS